MSELMTVGQALTMSSIDLLDLVNQSRASHGEATVRHNDFLARCKDELDGEPYETFVESAKGRAPAFEAIRMTIDQCKLVGMRESKGVRRWVLNRLNALEAERKQVAHSPVAIPDFMNPAEAARAWAAEFEAKQQARQALALAAPKVAFVDRYVEATGLFTFREVAKLLKANEARFREFLIDSKVMYYLGKKLTAYKNHEDAGRFAVKTDTAKNGHDYRQTFFTPKGVHWVAGQWAKHQEREAA